MRAGKFEQGARVMQGGVWSGLGRSPFIADVTPDQRNVRRLAVGVLAGFAVGLVAAMAAYVLVVAPYTLLSGYGSEGLQGMGKVALAFQDPHAKGLALTAARITVASVTDGVFLIAFVATAAALRGQALIRFVTSARAVRWRLLALGVALATLALIPAVIADSLSEPSPGGVPILAVAPDALGRGIYLLASLLLIPAALAEELFFRGWLMRHVASLSRNPLILMGVTAVLFSALHLDFTPNGFLTRAVMGFGLAYMTLRLGGIELAAGAHSANNLLIVLFLQPLLPAKPPSPGFDAVAAAEDIALLLGYVLIAEAVARIEPLRRLSGVEPRDLSPWTRSAPSA